MKGRQSYDGFQENVRWGRTPKSDGGDSPERWELLRVLCAWARRPLWSLESVGSVAHQFISTHPRSRVERLAPAPGSYEQTCPGLRMSVDGVGVGLTLPPHRISHGWSCRRGCVCVDVQGFGPRLAVQKFRCSTLEQEK